MRSWMVPLLLVASLAFLALVMGIVAHARETAAAVEGAATAVEGLLTHDTSSWVEADSLASDIRQLGGAISDAIDSVVAR